MTTASGRQSFHRPPRAWPPAVPTESLRIAPPPTVPPPAQHSVISTLFPVVGSVGIVGFALVYGNSAFLWIAGAIVVVMIAFSFGMRWSQKRGVRKKAAADARRYTKYLKSTDQELALAGELQRDALARLYPAPGRLWTLMVKREGLWERRPDHRDFLHARLGTGTVDLDRPVDLDLGFNPLTEYQEASLKDARKLVGYRGRLPQQPVVIDLAETGILSVAGDRPSARAWARALITQLAAFRAPHDLRIVTAFDPADASDWEFGKWLPHQRLEQAVPADDDGAPPLPALALAESTEELEALLEPELRPRVEQLRRLAEAGTGPRAPDLVAPELIVIVDGYHPGHPANGLAGFRELLARARELKAVVALLVDSREQEPGHVDARLTLHQGRRSRATYERTGPDAPIIEDLEPDGADPGLAEAVARMLAPLRLQEGADGRRSLSAEVRLTDLLDLGRRAASPPRPEALRVPIGIGDDGEVLTLDLKQAAEEGMGPHGILVGATGSGKSELLRSIVAGLAATHDPESLSFVLADFKGGAAFAELSRLPHVAGLITNLQRDLSLVDRMRDALTGEQERRQAMLRDAGNLDDVRAYRKRRAGDPTLAPLPDLLVIVDEFAELLAARPEFIDLFVGIGRVGRSLGIHLLLSSQRLDEGRLRGLESHLRYRICLRTYSAPESKLVLGTNDAYLLPSLPGLGYLKVDTSIYRQFRAALVSAPVRRPGAVAATPTGVRTFDAAAASPLDAGAATPADDLDPDRSDLDELVDRLAGPAGAPATAVHQVWVDPLPDALPLDAVLDPDDPPGALRAVVGEVDRPAEQRKEALELDLASGGGHVAVVGAPRTGKSTLLRTLVLSLAHTHSPDHVRFYAIDLGGGQLATLGGAPHVGGVAGRADREAVARVVAQVQGELEEREDLLRERGLESMAQARDQGVLADLFLLVDGWSTFRRDFEDLERDLERIAAAGLGLGVHVVVAANRWAEIRPALLDNLGTRLELKLNDPVDSLVSRQAAAALPEGVEGRGLTVEGLQFQGALPRMDGEAAAQGLSAAVEGQAADLAARFPDRRAEPIRLLPSRVDPRALPAPTRERVPIGLEERALGPVSVALTGLDPHFLVFGDAGAGKSSLLRLLAHGLAAAFPPSELRLVVIDVRRSLVDLADLPHLDGYAASSPAAAEAAARLAGEVSARMPDSSGELEDLVGRPSWEGPRHVVVCDDYDLLAGPTGSPLAPLLELLALGADVGLHVVLARRVGGSARGAYEPVFGRLRELGSPGVLLSGDPSEGLLLAGHKARSQPPGRGLLVRRGERPLTVQLALRGAGDPAPAVSVLGQRAS